MSGILSSVAIERVVRELLEVLGRQRARYMDRMVRHLDRLADDAESVLEDTMRVLSEIERSVERIARVPSLFAALIVSWFYAVLIESEDLVERLYDEIYSDDEF